MKKKKWFYHVKIQSNKGDTVVFNSDFNEGFPTLRELFEALIARIASEGADHVQAKGSVESKPPTH